MSTPDVPPTPPRVRPDAETRDALVLVKYTAALHATRQVLTLAERAAAEGKHLVLHVPRGFRPASTLRLFMANHPDLIRIETR
ncbi:MAG TPA: hypothetical protein VF400_12050 [Anaeromyxobacteraceae bacterium]